MSGLWSGGAPWIALALLAAGLGFALVPVFLRRRDSDDERGQQ